MMNRPVCCCPLVLLALVAVGCGDGRISTYPVSGKVVVDGRPVEGATVVLYPIEGDPDFMKERPFGRTDTQGEFNLTTFEKGDGAPAGNYKVMIRWTKSSPRSNQRAWGPDAFNGTYFNHETTPLTCEIVSDTNDLTPFELSTKNTRRGT